MQVIEVVGPSDTGKTTLIERLVERLSERGRVGTVKHIDCAPDIDTTGKDTARHREAGSAHTYGIGEDEWFATGDELTLEDALDDLSVECDYAVVEGYAGTDLPKIALGEIDVENAVLTASTFEDVDVENAVEAVESVERYESLASMVASVMESEHEDRAGAVATFTGRVREKEGPDDEPTEYLEYERYDEVAEERMATIREELEAREGVFEVRMHHRSGIVEAGEDAVYTVVLAGHRREAFRTVEDSIDRIKDEVPLFKKEVTVSEEFWAHEQ
jgi:molybdopterin synthase catalytic subunit